MVRTRPLLLFLTLACTGALLAAESKPGKPADATVTIHRCVDAKGHVTLQNDACPTGNQDTTRVLQRPKDAPARPATTAPPLLPPPEPEPMPLPAPRAPRIPPPDMYLCTSYDGIERYSESYDPNPRCEPIGFFYPLPYSTPGATPTCRWVEDSCVKLSDDDACAVWQRKLPEAQSEARRAFSDTAAYRKSELARITQIVDESCR